MASLLTGKCNVFLQGDKRILSETSIINCALSSKYLLVGILGTLHCLGCHVGLVKVEGNSLTGMKSERQMGGRMVERYSTHFFMFFTKLMYPDGGGAKGESHPGAASGV